MAGKKGQKKRFWSDDEKHTICAQARVAGVSVAQVARRYSMNANLIHKWLRDPRFAADVSDDDLEICEVSAFLPVEIEGVVSSSRMSQDGISASVATGPILAQRVDITLSNGRRILVEGSTGLSAVLALVEGLMV
jgi:transposase